MDITSLTSQTAHEHSRQKSFSAHTKYFFAKKLLNAILWGEAKLQRSNLVSIVARLNRVGIYKNGLARKTKVGLLKGASVLFVAFVLFMLFMLFINKPGGRAQDLLFVVPAKGSWHLAQELEKADIISSPVLFRVAALLNFGGKMHAGEYRIKNNHSYTDIINTVAKGRSARFKFTIPEGFSNHSISQALRLNTMLIGEIGAMPDEGTLLPETYFVYRNKYRRQIIKQMHREHNRVVKVLWGKRAAGLPVKTVKDAVILASIVEKETGIRAERKVVAGVFINRLNKKSYMQLQSDPTVIYALARGKPFERSLTYADLRVDDPYNSYKNYGLPPGAIANPGRLAIEAVLNPVKTDYFYFVADGTGGHAFAKDYEGHLENVKKWQAIKNGTQSKSEAPKEEAVAKK